MGNLLMSGEFAALRDVNLNSLRYYEKLGLLVPAYIDAHTKYRYYRLEQLCTLDTILFFIEVGMPLKKLKDYIDADGSLDQNRVLKDAQSAMEEKIASMRSMLEVTKYDLAQLEQNRWCNEQESLFTREINDRWFIIKPFKGEWERPMQREKESMELFHACKKAGMRTTYPAGIIIEWEDGQPSYSFFVQVLDNVQCDLHSVHIEKGTFRCMQFELTPGLDIPKMITDNFGQRITRPVILNHIHRDEHHLTRRYMEIQVPVENR